MTGSSIGRMRWRDPSGDPVLARAAPDADLSADECPLPSPPHRSDPARGPGPIVPPNSHSYPRIWWYTEYKSSRKCSAAGSTTLAGWPTGTRLPESAVPLPGHVRSPHPSGENGTRQSSGRHPHSIGGAVRTPSPPGLLYPQAAQLCRPHMPTSRLRHSLRCIKNQGTNPIRAKPMVARDL